jgi:hypothetical protein
MSASPCAGCLEYCSHIDGTAPAKSVGETQELQQRAATYVAMHGMQDAAQLFLLLAVAG